MRSGLFIARPSHRFCSPSLGLLLLAVIPTGVMISAPSKKTTTQPSTGSLPPAATRVLDSAQGNDKRNHWAFKTPARPPVPASKQNRWVRNPIDDFILARLQREKLKPSPEADRRTLI